jgi:hypothetical protein
MKNAKLLPMMFVIFLSTLLLWGCGREEPIERASHELFFDNLAGLCGLTFAGHSDFTLADNDDFTGASLVMHVASCTENEIRIPFIVNEDSSRTWVVTLHENGLLLKHDHRHADGTPEDITMYGGWSTDDGSMYVQRFPADDYTAELIPEAETNVWTLEINPETNQFIYFLERHDEPRYRAIFDLSEPL